MIEDVNFPENSAQRVENEYLQVSSHHVHVHQPADGFPRQMLDSLPTPIVIKNERRRWIFFNQAACEVMGHPREELEGKTDHDLFARERVAVLRRQDDAVLGAGKNQMGEEWIIRCHEPRRILIRKSLFEDPETGRRYIMGALQDVTEHLCTEDDLNDYHEHYRAIMGKSPRAVIVRDEHEEIVYANQSYLNLTKHTLDELQGMDPWAMFTEECGAIARGIHKKTIEGAQAASQPFLLEIICKDGATKQVEYSWAQIKYAGKPATMGSARDADEEKVIEKALPDKEQSYRRLFNGMISGFALHEIICDENGKPCDYRFLEVNPAFEALTGLSAEEVIGKRVLEVLPQTEGPWIEEYGRVALTGDPVSFVNYSRALDKYYEVVAYRPAPGQFAVVFNDTTERWRTEEILRRSEQRHRTLVEAVPDIIAEVDNDKNYTWLNEAGLDFFGPEAVGRNAAEFMANQEALVRAEATVTPLFDGTRERIRLETLQRRRDGAERILAWTCKPLRDEYGKIIGALSTARDITEQRRQKELILSQNVKLLEANRLKNEFLATMSHELRTPLTPIIGFAEILIDSIEEHEVEEACRNAPMQIKKNALRLMNLIEDLMDLSMIAKGQIKYSFAHESLNTAIEEAVERVSLEATKKGIALDVCPSLGPLPVKMDLLRIEQVACNLLNNAVKFSSPGTMIEVRTYRENGEVVAAVRDQGPGIEPRHHEAIFELFRQVDGSVTRRHGGAGIGLALAKRFVEAHGGRLWVESEPGRGSTFAFALPAGDE